MSSVSQQQNLHGLTLDKVKEKILTEARKALDEQNASPPDENVEKFMERWRLVSKEIGELDMMDSRDSTHWVLELMKDKDFGKYLTKYCSLMAESNCCVLPLFHEGDSIWHQTGK